MKEKYKRNVIKTLIILFIVFLLMLVGYINLGSTSMKVISESDKIKIDKIECRYLNSDPPVKVKILNNISPFVNILLFKHAENLGGFLDAVLQLQHGTQFF